MDRGSASSTFGGSTVMITGAASGIGLALSESLVSRGAHVWLTDVDAAAAKAAAEAIGERASWLQLDVRSAVSFENAAEQITAASAGIDFLFNNAGIGLAGEMHRLSVKHFDRIIDVNIRGVMNGIAARYPRMVDRGRGHIVNTASAGAFSQCPSVRHTR